MKKALLIIDPQNDFIDNPDFQGALAVNGAYEDMQRLIEYIKKEEFEDVFVTLDTHSRYDISHAAWWVNEQGEHPSPFTNITIDDVTSGVWRAVDPNMQAHSLFYVEELNRLDKYKLTVWPDHCILGTPGHEVNEQLKESLKEWEERNNKKVVYVYKGTNPLTEHYSGLKAEVVLPNAKETELNIDLIERLATYEVIEIAGEASSHCVANTAIDLLENFSEENKSKVVLLQDCMSPVSGFEDSEKMLFKKISDLGGVFQTTKAKPRLKM